MAPYLVVVATVDWEVDWSSACAKEKLTMFNHIDRAAALVAGLDDTPLFRSRAAGEPAAGDVLSNVTPAVRAATAVVPVKIFLMLMGIVSPRYVKRVALREARVGRCAPVSHPYCCVTPGASLCQPLVGCLLMSAAREN
jgi:hypothetical protein